MWIRFTAMALLALLTTPALAAAPVAHPPKVHATPRPVVHRKPRPRVAPADEYFGRLKMSILGVRNKVKDFGLQVDRDPTPRNEQAVLNAAVFVEDAMRDWARKYPYDKWLPRFAYALEEVYEEIPGAEAHRRAVRQLNYITAYFPASNYAKVGRIKLVAGVPMADPGSTPTPQSSLERLAMIDGKVQPTPPPAPTPMPTPTPSESPSPNASAAPAAAEPTGTPVPSPSPKRP